MKHLFTIISALLFIHLGLDFHTGHQLNRIETTLERIEQEQDAQRQDLIIIIENQAAIYQDSFHSTE
jgi:hypothetical protein